METRQHQKIFQTIVRYRTTADDDQFLKFWKGSANIRQPSV
jgi:hypothetical protein